MAKTVRDFYMRSEEDPNYKKGILEVSDNTEEAISQVKMTLLTEKGSVLGDPDFGLDVNRYLFDFDIDPFGLSNNANNQIDKYVSASKLKNITVEPSKFTDDRDRDVFVLEIGIDGDNPFGIFYG
jgi:hypothetical protein